MIRKTFFLSLLALTATLLFTQVSQAEARSHSRSRTSVQLNVGTGYRCNDAYVVRQYARPVVVPAAVYAPQHCYSPYYAPVYACQAPVYVEEVYVAPAPRPIGFGGLSFSWNFFK